jgi:L-fucose isomerase-like protein
MRHDPPLRIAFAAVVRGAFKGDGDGVAGRSRSTLAALAERLGADLVPAGGIVRDAAEAAAAANAVAAAQPDLLVLQHATFATGDLVAPLLRAARRVVVWAVPESAGARVGGPDGRRGPLPLNSLCGLQMTLSFAETARGGARERVAWCWGDPDDAALVRTLEALLRAERGALALERTRILAIGGTAPSFYGLEQPPLPHGATVVHRPLAALFERMADVSDADAIARADAWRAAEPLHAPLAHLIVAARIDAALADLAASLDANALAVRCWPEIPDTCGGMACAAMGRSADRGTPAACEGDLWGAASMRVLQGVAGEGSALLDLSDVDRERDALLLWHCGNAPLALAETPGSRLTTHFNRDGVGVVRDQVLRAGPATAYRLHPTPEGLRSATLTGTLLGAAAEPSFDGVRGFFANLAWAGRPITAFGAVASLLEARLPHHVALVGRDVGDALAALDLRLGATPLPAHAASVG